MSLDGLKTGVMALVIIALIAGAGALAMDAFQEDLGENACPDDYTYNTTDRTCCGKNQTGPTVVYCNSASATTGNQTGGTAAFNSTQEGLMGIGNATSYLSTIGIMIGIAALLAVVVTAFYFVGKR